MVINAENSNTPQNDIYTDPKLAQINANDPIYDMIKLNWKPFTATVLAVLAAIYFIQAFQESYDSSMQASADIFQRLQANYKEHIKLTSELNALKINAAKTDPSKADEVKDNTSKIEDLNKKISESKSQIEQLLTSASDSREPYKSFAKLYKGIADKESSPAVSIEILKSFSNWKETGSPGSTERMNAELGAMQLARLQLESNEDFEKGKSIITDLATNGEFTAVSAAKILASFAKTEAERTEAKNVINKLIERQPEQSDLLKETLSAL